MVSVNAVNSVVLPSGALKKVNPVNWNKVESPLSFLDGLEYGWDVPLRHPDLKGGKTMEQRGWVSLWIGSLPDEKSAEVYMEEEWNENASDDQPLPQFGRDWKLSHNQDFLFHEIHYASQSLAKLLGGWAVEDSFAKPADPAA